MLEPPPIILRGGRALLAPPLPEPEGPGRGEECYFIVPCFSVFATQSTVVYKVPDFDPIVTGARFRTRCAVAVPNQLYTNYYSRLFVTYLC